MHRAKSDIECSEVAPRCYVTCLSLRRFLRSDAGLQQLSLRDIPVVPPASVVLQNDMVVATSAVFHTLPRCQFLGTWSSASSQISSAQLLLTALVDSINQ